MEWELSDVETEVHDVAVVDHVFFPFYVHLAGFLDGVLRSQRHEVVVFDYFGPYEAFLKVCMDDARCLGAFVPRRNVQARTSSGPAVK